MTRVLGLSILNCLLIVNFAYGKKAAVSVPKTPDVSFLEMAEDIEREAWWVLTDVRVDGKTSPFRILRAAFLKQDFKKNNKSKTKLSFKFCQRLKLLGPDKNTWRVESECQKPNPEVGRLKKLSATRWLVEWRTEQFKDHFGLGTTILYPRLSCDFDLSPTGRIVSMKCPLYARNRNVEEIVELKTFQYEAKSPSIMKLKGEVKKDLQVVATIQTEVPMNGDVVVKEKRILQKPVEAPAVISDSKRAQQSNVRKNEDLDGQQKNQSQDQNQEKSEQQTHQEGIREVRPEVSQEVPTGQKENYQENHPEAYSPENGGYVGGQGPLEDIGPSEAPPIEGIKEEDEHGLEGYEIRPEPVTSSPDGR